MIKFRRCARRTGLNTVCSRSGPTQPAELASAYAMLADPFSSYLSGATIAMIGGKPSSRRRGNSRNIDRSGVFVSSAKA